MPIPLALSIIDHAAAQGGYELNVSIKSHGMNPFSMQRETAARETGGVLDMAPAAGPHGNHFFTWISACLGLYHVLLQREPAFSMWDFLRLSSEGISAVLG